MSKKHPFKHVSFVKTAMKTTQYPHICDKGGTPLPEFAMAGRSNVGKSTLFNHLTRHKIAKTSSTPGKTQALNFFRIDDNLACVDLPGYGFARVPTVVRRQWGPMIQDYFQNRENLKLLLFLVDIRRIPNEDDIVLYDWAKASGIQTLLVLTKVDKVKNNEKAANTRSILQAFEGIPQDAYIHYSATKNIGRPELIAMINRVMTLEEDPDE